MSDAVAIAILHYGDPSWTIRCAQSVLRAESFGLDSAPLLICYDNDPRLDAAEWSGEIAPFTVISSDQNHGFAGGANRAIAEARRQGARWVWLLNNDTEVSAEALPRLLATAQSERAALVGPRILDGSGDKIWHDGGGVRWPSGQPDCPRLGETPPDPTAALEVEFVCGCAPLIDGEVFESVGGFDERYFAYYEDLDLSLRLRARGERTIHEPRAVIRHAGSASTGEGSPFTRYYSLRNRRLFRELHAPDREAARRHAAAESRSMRWKALRSALRGRRSEAKAIRQALADHAARRFGARSEEDSGWNPGSVEERKV